MQPFASRSSGGTTYNKRRRTGSGIFGMRAPPISGVAVTRHVMLTIALACLWLLLSGHFEPLLLALGALSIAFVVWISSRMNIVDGESYPFGLLPKLTNYWLWLLKEIISSFSANRKRITVSVTQVCRSRLFISMGCMNYVIPDCI